MKLLIDANIILDVLQARDPYVSDSSTIWKLCETERATGTVSALSFANLVYVMRRELNSEMIQTTLTRLSLIFTIEDLRFADLQKAAEKKWDDFEDAVHAVIAERIGADNIITRNVRDFMESSVPAYTPTELLSRM